MKQTIKTITKKAYAKVNLALDVLGRRENGYHDVSMIMHNLDLYDTLTFMAEIPACIEQVCGERAGQRERQRGGQEEYENQHGGQAEYENQLHGEDATGMEIRLTCDQLFVPCDESNLVWRAIRLMTDRYHLSGRVQVHIEKRIPVAAGMAGGSTDCAAALHAMRELYGLDVDDETLMRLGVTLGADVPYCIMAKPALSEGIGEILTELASLPDCHIVVAKPAVSVSTGMVYQRLDACEAYHHPDVAGMAKALAAHDLAGVTDRMENVLETVTVSLYPQIEEIKQTLKRFGAENAIMSGSGPTVFAIFKEPTAAGRAAQEVRAKFGLQEVYVTRPI